MLLALLAAAALASACASGTAPAPALTDHEIAMVVRTANDGEIELGELAASSAADTRARDLAQMMVREHTAANERAAALFRERNLVPAESGISNELRSRASAEAKSLSAAGGPQLDRAYVDGQVRMHRDLLRMIDETLYPAARDQNLRDYLTSMRATVAAHLGHAESVSRGLPR
jgi:putative membrane protein